MSEERLGLDRKEARTRLRSLANETKEALKQSEELQKQVKSGTGQTSELMSQISALTSKIKGLSLQYDLTRDWYNTYLLETLDKESRTLKWLTIGLIALTTVLTVFTGFLVLGIRIP